MVNNFLRQALTNQIPQKRDVINNGIAPEELLKKQNLVVENIEPATFEINQDNQNYIGINFSPELDQKFPPHVAKLYIEAENGKYRIRAHHASQKEPFNTELSQPPILSFSQQLEGENVTDKLRQISGRMRMFSQENSEAKKIRCWLLKLKQKLNLSCIVIHDRTEFEIPWEMLELLENDYLGASLITVRWQDIEDSNCWEETNKLVNLEFQPEYCCGNIVAYTNTKDFKNIEQEINIINQFQSQCFQKIDEFLTHLEQLNSEVSLMFIASHGFFGQNISQMCLGEEDPKQRISLTQIYDYDFEFFKTSRSIVFMNACHSGRLRRDETLDIINNNYRFGFPTFFLKKGARGVIGTLGKVIDKYAAQITNNFFTEYQRNPDLPVAAILKNIRAEAAQQFKANKTEDNRKLFIFTFMYIYYGNPMTTLQLTPKGE
ncbi:MAG TPA: CHAT domain-containing protein [Nostocaceae cyanobacterium]|nr:CHAT domain-containing protein [Nostocaceae cyanobacterium]